MSPAFRYTARLYDGEAVSGTLEVETLERAAAHLRGRALFVTSLRAGLEPRSVVSTLFSRARRFAGARAAFMRSMATLVSAGIPLRRALDIAIAQCADGTFRESLRSVGCDLDAGVSLADALARQPEFPPIAAALVRAGERAGALDDAFSRLATWAERERSVRSRVQSALAYPALVSLAALAVLLLLVRQTAPALAAMFEQMNVPVPASTRALLWLGRAGSSPRSWIVLACGAPVFLAAAVALARSRRLSSLRESLELTLPVFGTLRRKQVLAALARALSMLLYCGVELLDALENCDAIVSFAAYRAALTDVRSGLREGQPLSDRLDGALFDPLFINLVRVGEETGRLDALLSRLAEFYESDLDDALRALSSLLEPALILVLGTVVGAIAAAILVPFYSLVGSIR